MDHRSPLARTVRVVGRGVVRRRWLWCTGVLSVRDRPFGPPRPGTGWRILSSCGPSWAAQGCQGFLWGWLLSLVKGQRLFTRGDVSRHPLGRELVSIHHVSIGGLSRRHGDTLAVPLGLPLISARRRDQGRCGTTIRALPVRRLAPVGPDDCG
jgi:hypothetical protein